MARSKLYKATIKKVDPEKGQNEHIREIYVIEKSMTKAASKLCDELDPDEELQHMNLISEECYV